jgi:glutamate/tyrosine decarboxylase-like PLP-dependent enzyme
MRRRIQELEKISRQLDPGPELREDFLGQVQNYAESFLARLPSTNTYTPDEGRQGFPAPLFEETPASMAGTLDIFRREVDTTGILPPSGGQMGYIPGGGLYPSALGDFLADISNRYSGVAFAGPGAAALEGALVRWMCDLVGYPSSAAGDLASGGSIATLSALVTARDAHGIEPSNIDRTRIYLTEHAHHCVDSALHVCGMGRVCKRTVPMDRHHRMDVAALEKLIREDRERGLRPWLVVASAGTTDTGAVDAIVPIARIARDHGLWLHLDAAYGGFFILCEEARESLDGMALADSIVMDPHKGLGIPYGTGAVLVKDGRLLAESNRYYANYMQDAIQAERHEGTPYSPSDYSLELTRAFRGPRMWFPLRLFGLQTFRAALAEKIWLARYFREELDGLERWEVGPVPDLSIVTFRYRPESGDADTFNRRLLEAVHRDGRVFITSTRMDGRFTLRLAVLNFRTHLAQVDYLLALLRRSAADLEASGGAEATGQ